MSGRLDGLGGHAYAPGFGPSPWDRFMVEMAQMDLLPMALAIAVGVIITAWTMWAVSGPATPEGRQRRARRAPVRSKRTPVERDELRASLRQLRQARTAA